MFREIPNNIKLIKLYILFSFIICWLSVSTSMEDILIFLDSNVLDIKYLINFLRQFSVYICFLFSILIFLIFNKRIDFKKYIVFYFLLAYFFSQSFGLFFSDNDLKNISFIISATTIIINIILIDSFFSNKEKKYFLFISFVILNIVFFLTFIPIFIKYLSGGSIYGGFITTEPFLNKTSPRSSGLARTALIILIFLEFFEINYLNKHIKKVLFLKISFLTFIYLFQSRTIVFLTILTYLVIFLNKNEITLKQTVRFVSLYFLVPISLFFLLSTINSYKFTTITYEVENKDLTYIEHLNSNQLKIFRVIKKENVTSGRFDDWKKILKNMSGKNIIYGFGAQGDRYLINQSASNGILYAYTSSGVIGLMLFVIFLVMVGFKVIKIFIFQFRRNLNDIFHCIIITIFSMRGILETSYAVFSIDLILFILAVGFIFDNNVKIKDIKNKFYK